jgi:hypothetical protein
VRSKPCGAPIRWTECSEDHEGHVASVTSVTGRTRRDVRERPHWDRGGGSVQQVRIERKTPIRERPNRSTVLPLDPRDPDILRAKLLQRRGTDRSVPTGSGPARAQ